MLNLKVSIFTHQCQVRFSVKSFYLHLYISDTNKPSIESCQVRFISNGGTQRLSNVGSSACNLQKDIYGRLQVQNVSIDLSAVFEIIIDTHVSRPPYVSREIFGITDVTIHLNRYTVTGKFSTMLGNFN